MLNENSKEISLNEILKQNEYIEKVREINEKEGKEKKFYSLAMGCQMNAHDSEKLCSMLLRMGYKQTFTQNDADFIIYNTCCIRENAEDKVYGKLGYLKHLKRKNPNLIIALCGCMMQESHVIEKIKSSYRHTDIIFGTYNLHKLPELTYHHIMTKSMIFDIWEEHGEIIEDTNYKREYPFKASVNIMYGCNNPSCA